MPSLHLSGLLRHGTAYSERTLGVIDGQGLHRQACLPISEYADAFELVEALQTVFSSLVAQGVALLGEDGRVRLSSAEPFRPDFGEQDASALLDPLWSLLGFPSCDPFDLTTSLTAPHPVVHAFFKPTFSEVSPDSLRWVRQQSASRLGSVVAFDFSQTEEISLLLDGLTDGEAERLDDLLALAAEGRTIRVHPAAGDVRQGVLATAGSGRPDFEWTDPRENAPFHRLRLTIRKEVP